MYLVLPSAKLLSRTGKSKPQYGAVQKTLNVRAAASSSVLGISYGAG